MSSIDAMLQVASCLAANPGCDLPGVMADLHEMLPLRLCCNAHRTRNGCAPVGLAVQCRIAT